MADTVIQNIMPGSTYKPQRREHETKNPESDFKKMLEETKETKPEETAPQEPGIKGEQTEDGQAKEEPDGIPYLLGLMGAGMPQMPVIKEPEPVLPEDGSKVSGVEQPDGEQAVAGTDAYLEGNATEPQVSAPEEKQQIWHEKAIEESKSQNVVAEKQPKETTETETIVPKEPKVPVQEETAAVNTELKAEKQQGTEQGANASKKTSAQEAPEPEMTTVASYLQKDYAVQQSKAMQEPQTVHVNEAHPEELTKDVADVIAKSVQTGKQEFEIQLEPLRLGKLAIKVSYEAGKAAVSIICSSTKTLESLAQNAKEISAILDNRLGTETAIIVEHPEADYLNQHNQQKEENQREQESRQKSYHPQDEERTKQSDFLQQLRLGLV